MPKKLGLNSKAEDARSRKAEASKEKKVKDEQEKTDKYWQELEGPASKASRRRHEGEEKRAESIARRAEAKKLAEQEEKEMEGYGKKVDKRSVRVSGPKVTAAELSKQKDLDKQKLQTQVEESAKRDARVVEAQDYEKMVAVENINRSDDVIDARSVEAAIAHMSVAEELPVDRHPERRARASYKAFEEAELARLKAEKPGMTLNQYKELVWKMWKKSPDNPMNQVAAAH